MKSILLVGSLVVLQIATLAVEAFEPHQNRVVKSTLPDPPRMCPIWRSRRSVILPGFEGGYIGEDPYEGCIPWEYKHPNVELSLNDGDWDVFEPKNLETRSEKLGGKLKKKQRKASDKKKPKSKYDPLQKSGYARKTAVPLMCPFGRSLVWPENPILEDRYKGCTPWEYNYPTVESKETDFGTIFEILGFELKDSEIEKLKKKAKYGRKSTLPEPCPPGFTPDTFPGCYEVENEPWWWG